jgi:hypothetical protein
VCVCAHRHTNVYICIHIYSCINLCIYIHIYVCICIYRPTALVRALQKLGMYADRRYMYTLQALHIHRQACIYTLYMHLYL